MAGLDLKYDGIVSQHAGELLFNLPETRDIRCLCAKSYWRSLNNFVFGLIFCEKLITPGRDENGAVSPAPLPPLFEGGPTPGENLLKLFHEKRVFRGRPKNAVTADQLTKDASDAGLIKQTLKRLESLVRGPHSIYWREQMIREVYLSCNPAGNEWHKKDGFWQIKGRENFTPDRDKEGAVPTDYVRHIRDAVKSALLPLGILNKRQITDSILEGYIKRNVVAHLPIHSTSNSKQDVDFENPEKSERIFHVTRSSLAEAEVGQRLWDVQSLTVPGLLKSMIEKAARESDASKRRSVVIRQIQDASTDGRLDPIRTGLAEAVALARQNDFHGLGKLVKDLEARYPQYDAIPQPRVLLIGDSNNLYRDAIAVLHEMGAGEDDAYMTPEFLRVFDELVPMRGIDRSKN